MARRFDAQGRLIIDWNDVKHGVAPPTPDDVTVMTDGPRIDSADKLREVLIEFDYLARAGAERS